MTSAPAVWNTIIHAAHVDGHTRTSPARSRCSFSTEVMTRTRPRYVPPDAAIPLLRKHLEHDSWWIVAGAITALRKIGPRAKPAAPDLLLLLRHSVDTCRKNAYLALEALDPALLKDQPAAERVRNELEERLPAPK